MPNARRPHAMKVVAGTVRADRAESPDVPRFDPVIEFPPPPQHLNPDGAALWNFLGPQLTTVGVLQVVDVYPLQQLCYEWQQHVHLQKANMPITASQNNALLALFATFGIGPAARRKVSAKLSDAAPANRFAKYGQSGK